MKNHATKSDHDNNPTLSVSYKSPVLADNLLYTLPDAVIITDPNFIITGFNPAAEAIYGLSPHEAIGKLLFDIVQFELKGSTLGEAITELHNNGSWNGDILFHRYNEQELFFNTRCTLIRDETGQISAIVLVNHNVTDRLKQQQNLALAENKYRVVVESLSEANEKLKQGELLFRSFMTNTPTLGWVYDEDGNFVYGNPLFMETVGITENAIGKHILEFSSPQMAEPILSKNRHVLQKGESLISEDELIDKTGTLRYFLAHWFILASSDNKRFIGGQAVEITERKKIEVQLLNEQVQKQKMINQATLHAQEEERNKISRELHDNVNQLLMSSRLHIDVAKNSPDNYDDLLDKASEYLLMAVEEIRLLSKALNSKVISSVGLQKSIADITDNMQQLNNIEVMTDLNESAIKKLSQEQQLMVFRIVQEQSNNIVKYAEATHVSITLTDAVNNIKLVVSDNGKGFNKEEQKVTGIGFINIFNRVDAYNGKVNIISSPGKGCLLNISFPIISTN